jgi:hypothetical protein
MAPPRGAEARFLGTESSPVFVRTPKENLPWIRRFDALEELRRALLEFRETYNSSRLIRRNGFRPPEAVR